MEIVLRAFVVFAFLWLVTRVVGKRQLGQMSAFQLVLLVVMGDLIQQGVTQEDYSLAGAVLAVSTFALLTVLVSWVSWRWRRTRPYLEGRPVIVVRDGQLQEVDMRYERLPEGEIFEAAREQGIKRLSDIELAVLEPDGQLSFFQRREEADSQSGPRSTPV